MSEVLVYATLAQADDVRGQLARACRATGIDVRLELFGSGSLFQRLRVRRAPPPPDVVIWFGPYAAHSAGMQGLLQAYRPVALPDRAAHDPQWRWVAVDYQAFSVAGTVPLSRFDDLLNSPRLVLANPEQSEVGMLCALAVLDRFRQADGDVERGWGWWQQRAQSGMYLAADDARALAALDDGRVDHALTLHGRGEPLVGLAPVPHAIGLSATARDPDAARRLIDWLVSAEAARPDQLSAWQATTNGLATLLDVARPLDVDWATREYSAVRKRWAQSGFGPTLASP